MALHHRARSERGSHPSGTPVAIQRATGCASHPLSLEAGEGKSEKHRRAVSLRLGEGPRESRIDQTKPNTSGQCSTIFFGRCRSQKQTHSRRSVALDHRAEAARPSPGTARFSPIQEREARRTALSRSGRGAEKCKNKPIRRRAELKAKQCQGRGPFQMRQARRSSANRRIRRARS